MIGYRLGRCRRPHTGFRPAAVQRQRPGQRQQGGAAGAVEPQHAAGTQHPQRLRARAGVAEHDDEIDARKHQRQRCVLRPLRLRWVDELGQEGRHEQVTLGIGHGHQKAAREDGACRRALAAIRPGRDRQRALGAQQPNPQVGQVDDADPLDHREPELRRRQQRAQPQRRRTDENEVRQHRPQHARQRRANAEARAVRQRQQHRGPGGGDGDESDEGEDQQCLRHRGGPVGESDRRQTCYFKRAGGRAAPGPIRARACRARYALLPPPDSPGPQRCSVCPTPRSVSC